jgi:large-conductance mechanosensitive channel
MITLITIWGQVVKHPFDFIAIVMVIILLCLKKINKLISYIYKKLKSWLKR